MAENIIKVGPGPEALAPAGHRRNEQLKKRTDRLNKIAENMLANTETPVYAVDPKKLKEEPEILKHYNPHNFSFEVSNKVPGKVYFWCRDDRNAMAQKQAEARMWLGPDTAGWEVVGNCSCGPKHGKDCPFPECPELKDVNGYRKIGDVLLMRIDLDTYTKIHKRMLVMQRYREMNVAESLTDFIKRYEGLVNVTSGKGDPRDLYQKQFGGRLIHTSAGPRGEDLE